VTERRPDPRLLDDPPQWAFAWRNAWIAARIQLNAALWRARHCYPAIPRLWVGLRRR
jgi:hypothetical protein